MKYQDIVPFYQKLNYKCKPGTIDETFSCGKTPEEAKKNYEKLRKEKISHKTSKEILKEISAPVKKLETVVSKAKKEIASRKVSETTKKELKESIKKAKEGVKSPKVSSNPVDQMKPGEIWNAGPVGDIKIEKVSNNNITITANGQTDTMSKSDLKAALKDYKIQKGSINPTLYMDISDKISDKFKSALIHYTEFDYSAINKISAGRKLDKRDLDYIPNERGNTPEEKLKYVNNEITILKDAFRTHLLPIGTVAYRGISKSAFDRLKDANVGDTINMKSFSSTTMTKDKAMEFSTTKDKPTVIKYNIPSGSRAIFVSPFSKYSDEQELVIDSDTKFRFGGIDESSDTRVITLEYITDTSKQNSTPLIKLSMKHPGNWSTAASLDTKIKKELKIGIQDVLDVLKSVGYFKEDPKEVALNEAYKRIAQEIFDTHIKLNANCKQEEKVGSGPGSCSGGLKDSIQPAKVDLHPKLDPGDYDGLLKASKAIRNDKSEPDRVLRRMMAEEVERKFIRETKESVQTFKEANDEFIKNSGNDTWNKLSSESQSAIRGYTSSDYGVINSALAENIIRPEVALIKAAMKPLEKETILYRGVSFDLPKDVTKFGTIWENKPFASCSTGSFIAEEAALGKLTHDGVAKIPTVLEILTSKNTKGFAVGKNSFHATADAGSEVILDTGTKFQTLSVDKSGGIRKITVRVVDD